MAEFDSRSMRAGRVHTLEAVQTSGRDDTFLCDLCKRADMTWNNNQLQHEDPCALHPTPPRMPCMQTSSLRLCVFSVLAASTGPSSAG